MLTCKVTPHFFHLSYFCFQSTAMAFETVNEENVYTCTGQPLRSDIANMVEWMLNEDFNTVYNSILDFWFTLHCKTIIIINATFTPQFIKRGAKEDGMQKRGQSWNVVLGHKALCWKGWAKKTLHPYILLVTLLFLVCPSVKACLCFRLVQRYT